jgi:hypothetical protein
MVLEKSLRQDIRIDCIAKFQPRQPDGDVKVGEPTLAFITPGTSIFERVHCRFETILVSDERSYL